MITKRKGKEPVATPPIKDVAVIYALACLAVVISTFLFPILGLTQFGGVWIALAFIALTLYFAERRGGLDAFDLRMGGIWGGPWVKPPQILKETAIALLLSAAIFIPYFFAYKYIVAGGRAFTPHLPADFLSLALGHLVVVALPEEMLFRGFIQKRLLGGRSKVLKVLGTADTATATATATGDDAATNKAASPMRVSAAIVVQAALFALMHLLSFEGNPLRLLVFFPGLLFGLVRQWRGGLGAAIILHWLSNLVGLLLHTGFFVDP